MPKQEPPNPRVEWTTHILPAALLAITLALAATPAITLARALIDHAGDLPAELLAPRRLVLLLRSLLTAALIAAIATLAAYPLARVLTARTTRATTLLGALILCPLWLPPFMIYAAGNLLRDPSTIVGRAVVELATSSPDLRWVTIWAGYAVAVIGLALWAAPIAALLIAAGWGARSGLYDDMIALEPVGRLQRLRFNLRLRRPLLLRSFVLISVLMLGSAVPLHLAQLDTWSIVTWRSLTERPPEQWGSVWASALPMLIAALIGARVIASAVCDRAAPDQDATPAHPVSRANALAAILIFAAAVLMPLLAMLLTLDDPRSLLVFWQRRAGAVGDTALRAFVAALIALLIAAATAFSAASPARAHRRIARAALVTLCVLGLTPGVLIGAAIARDGIIGLDLPRLAPSWASLTRYAFVGAVVGTLCAASESADRRSARIQAAGASPRAWAIATLPAILLPLIATAPVVALLAMFEIEAAVLVTPPGVESLPQQLLSDLHYTRLEQLSAAGVNLLTLALISAALVSAVFSRRITPAPAATRHDRAGTPL